MSVTLQAPVIRRRWWGADSNPGMPIGVWAAQANLTGDATGGELVLEFLFNPATAPTDSKLYSAEWITLRDAPSASGREVEVNTVNMDDVFGAWNQGFQLLLVPSAGLQKRIRPIDQIPSKWFLGHQRFAGIATTLSFRKTNVDMETLTVGGQGYIWTPRSLLVEGGLQRPTNAMW